MIFGVSFQMKTEDVSALDRSLRQLWFLMKQPSESFGHFVDIARSPQFVEFNRNLGTVTVNAVNTHTAAAVSIADWIEKEVSEFGRAAFLFNTDFGEEMRPAVFKLCWAPIGDAQENVIYMTLLANKVEGVPKIYSSGVISQDILGYQLVYLVMEHCGDSLGTVFEDCGQNVSNFNQLRSVATDAIQQVCSCLLQAKKAGVLHCDILPDNIMVRNGNVFVVGWGHACVLRDSVMSNNMRDFILRMGGSFKPLQNNNKYNGKVTYANCFRSMRILIGHTYRSVMDDFESLFYVVVRCFSCVGTGNFDYRAGLLKRFCALGKDGKRQKVLVRAEEMTGFEKLFFQQVDMINDHETRVGYYEYPEVSMKSLGGVWKNTEDEILKAAVMKYGKTQWARISSLLVRKTPKQCKARWYEWLDPSIKKTEWSKEEDEKLLHLAKLMPTQWRTIAPIIGRAPAQCLERYQRLLDEAESRAAGQEDLGLRGSDAQEARKLRPGEIDPNPESKAARPDPVDMDEDEKDMLSEARARLANTMGKKAKRKARERQLEEARRLAALQKRRELKAAGVELKPMKAKKGNKAHLDYNVEIPYEKKPMPGFYDTTEELDKKDKPAEDALKGRFLETLEAKGRTQREEDARTEAKRKREKRGPIKFVSAAGAKGDDAAREREEAEQVAKRARLVLPAPQVTDSDLEAIAKLGQQSALARELVGNGQADALLGDYTQNSAAAATAAATAARTPAVQGNRIMAEALAQRMAANQATPLLLGAKAGGDATVVFKSETFTADVAGPMATPNPLAASLAARTGSSVAVRDELGLNTPAHDMGATLRERKTAGRGLREQLAQRLSALPKPRNEIEIAIPDAPQPPSSALAPGADIVEDQADVERRMEKMRILGAEEERMRRSQCVQRGLPRPTALPVNPQDAVGSLAAASGAEAEAVAMIGREMCQLIAHDAQHFPEAGVAILRPPPGLQISPLDDIAADEIALARALIVAETSPAAADASADDSVWRAAEQRHTWVGSGFVPTTDVSPAQRIDKHRTDLDSRRSTMAALAGRAAKVEKRLGVVLGGYQARSKAIAEKIGCAYEGFERAQMDARAFAALHAAEQATVPGRLQRSQEEVEQIEARERMLQTEYQALVERRNALL
ncbi:Pre-mRNA-splicing factor cef1 [Kickxella alabastrina]|uniref:Pre-mRNA-splicing factor cef1 n=1 Tax=Kickxella alabastrina TaxID=61397 RepID=A0ACC1IVW6_9FUNG|nr:Pre-mRNA-splicing factor cef1 [Kickxella alabastrina]